MHIYMTNGKSQALNLQLPVSLSPKNTQCSSRFIATSFVYLLIAHVSVCVCMHTAACM